MLLALAALAVSAACEQPDDRRVARAAEFAEELATRPVPSTAPPTSTSTTVRPTTTTTVRPTTTTTIDRCANADINAGTRLESGINVDRGRTGGSSTLHVQNGSSLDATVKLVADDLLIRHIFVRATESTSAYNIPPGSYRLLVSQGKIWDADAQQFQCNRRAFEFVDGADFSEDATSYSVLRITLHAVPQGNAATRTISVDAYNQAGG